MLLTEPKKNFVLENFLSQSGEKKNVRQLHLKLHIMLVKVNVASSVSSLDKSQVEHSSSLRSS